MPSHAPVNYHFDLYRYWDAQRQGRAMPARRNLEPAGMRALLPYISLIDQVEEGYRYRLVGTAVTEDLGHDLTGGIVGKFVNPPAYAAAIIGIFDRVFANRQPLLTTGEYRAASKAIHSISRLMLPLSEDGVRVNMVIFTRVARFSRNSVAGFDWLHGAPGRVCGLDEVTGADDIIARSAAWEQECMSADAA